MMRCAHCGTEFLPKHQRGRFCRPKCRMAAWQAKQEAALAEAKAAVAQAAAALERLDRIRR